MDFKKKQNDCCSIPITIVISFYFRLKTFYSLFGTNIIRLAEILLVQGDQDEDFSLPNF